MACCTTLCVRCIVGGIGLGIVVVVIIIIGVAFLFVSSTSLFFFFFFVVVVVVWFIRGVHRVYEFALISTLALSLIIVIKSKENILLLFFFLWSYLLKSFTNEFFGFLVLVNGPLFRQCHLFSSSAIYYH